MSIDDLDTLFADDSDDHILCPACADSGHHAGCARCAGAGYVLLSSLNPDERFAAGLLPIDWARPMGDATLPALDDEEEQDHPDGYLTDDNDDT